MVKLNWRKRQELLWSSRFELLADKAQDARLQDFYGAGVVAGTTAIGEVPMVAMDFETTGLDPESDGIISIGLVEMNHQRITCRQARHWILKPREDLKSDAVTVHGITHSKVESAPDFLTILDDMLALLAGKIVVVHYRSIERKFLHAALKSRLGEGIEFPVIDTMELEVRLWRRHTAGMMERYIGQPAVSMRLADSRARYNLPFYNPHDALTDALACGELLIAQLANHYSPDTPVKELWN